jgi:N-methylhydantoinase A
MAPGRTARGPAVVTEDETSIVLPAGWIARARPDGCVALAPEDRP